LFRSLFRHWLGDRAPSIKEERALRVPSVRHMNVNPSQVTLNALDTQPFELAGAPAGVKPEWRVVQPGQGTIDQGGLYQAPRTVWFSRKVVVVAKVTNSATLVEERSAEIQLTNSRLVVPLLYLFLFAVSTCSILQIAFCFPDLSQDSSPFVVGPSKVLLKPGETLPFAATEEVRWSPNAPSGVFTAGGAGQYLVDATRALDADQVQRGRVEVSDVSLRIEPALPRLGPGQSMQLVARADGAEVIGFRGEICDQEGLCTAPEDIDESRVVDVTVTARRTARPAPRIQDDMSGGGTSGEGGASPEAHARPHSGGSAGTQDQPEKRAEPLTASVKLRLVPAPIGMRTLILYTLLFGALGSVLHAIKSLVAFVGNGTFSSRWALFYFSQPYVGALMALFVVFIVKADLAASPRTPDNFVTVASIAVLAGLFSDTAAQKLKEIFDTVVGVGADRRADKLATGSSATPSNTALAPQLTAVIPSTTPANAPVQLTLNGTAFARGCYVLVDNKQRSPSQASATQLKIELAAADIPQPATLDLVVVNPNGTPSEALKLTVTSGFTQAPSGTVRPTT
jgi:hypothetical protein